MKVMFITQRVNPQTHTQMWIIAKRYVFYCLKAKLSSAELKTLYFSARITPTHWPRIASFCAGLELTGHICLMSGPHTLPV